MRSRPGTVEFAFATAAAAAIGLGTVLVLAQASQAGPAPRYCAIDIRCSVNGAPPSDDFCWVAETNDIATLYYDFVGGEAEIIDSRLGVIGTYTGTTLTRTFPAEPDTTNQSVSHTATFQAIGSTTCTTGIFSDSVFFQWWWSGTPTPTPTPTFTPTPTATPSATPAPSACAESWPVTRIVTVGKGQSPDNNAKVVHAITGNIVDPASLGATAHRIDVCAGAFVTAVVSDASGTPTNTAGGSLACSSDGCSGVVVRVEKYESTSEDGRDTDRITFIPR